MGTKIAAESEIMNGRPLRSLLGLLCLCLVGPVWAENGNDNDDAALDDPPEIELVRRGSDYQGQMLAARFPDEARWLTANGTEFLTLEKPETVPGRQGAAVILADVGQSPAAGLAAGLREHLPAGGWRTLTFSAPEPLIDPLPARVFPPRRATREDDGEGPPDVDADADDDNEENAATDADEPGDPVEERGLTIDVLDDDVTDEGRVEDYQTRSLARVEAAIAHLRQQGFENIALIGIGDGADIMTRYAEQNHLQFQPGGLGLVWVAPRFREPLDRDLDGFLGPNWAIPILDLADTRARHGNDARRRDAARRGRLAHYAQQRVPLSRAMAPGSHRRVAFRVRGWLTQNMLGMEL